MRQKRIKDLEQLIVRLQAENIALRYANPHANALQGTSARADSLPSTDVAEETRPGPFGGSFHMSEPNIRNGVYAANERIVQSQTITLQRTTYRLPNEQAKALETFLREHIKAEMLNIGLGQTLGNGPVPKVTFIDGQRVVETARLEGTITITTTPDVQKVIGGLIQIMQKDVAKKLPLRDEGKEANYRDGQNNSIRPQPPRVSNGAFRDTKTPTKAD